jgi:predicted nucleic acid-binding protein
VSHLLLDTSVLIAWFHAEGEQHVEQARALQRAHLKGDLRVHVLDLAIYEVGNVLVRALRWPAAQVADQIDDLAIICGSPITLTPTWARQAAQLAEEHALSFYDAAWAAVARDLDVPLVSADRELLRAGLAVSPPQVVEQLGLDPSVP